MPTPMTLIQPEGLRVSLPGVNVLSPPALTESYLAIDWTWPKIERLWAKGKILGSSIDPSAGSVTFNFTDMGVLGLSRVLPMNPGTNIIRDEPVVLGMTMYDGSILYSSIASAYQWRTTTNSTIVTRLMNASLSNFDWVFFVFKP